MKSVDELVRQHCPHGVRYRPLGEVVKNFDRFRKPVTKAARTSGAYPYYGANGIQDYVGDFIFDGTFLLIGEDGSVRTPYGKPVLNWATGKIWVNNHAHVLQAKSPDLDLRFLYYALQSINISDYVTGGTQPKLNQANMNRIPIPLPPLVVQQELVEILDRFTTLEAELEVQLNAEIEARGSQYERLMHDVVSTINATKEPLRQLGEWRGGITPSKSNLRYWEAGSIPWLASMDVSDSEGKSIRGRVTPVALAETSLRLIPSPSVVTVMRSNILRRRLPVGLVDVDTTVNQDIRALIPRDDIDADYVYQVIRSTSETIRRAVVRTDGSMAAVNSSAFLEWTIPVPSVAEQRRIAARLRELDTVLNDLRQALVSELAARRKQYEYYRDRLLAFEEASA